MKRLLLLFVLFSLSSHANTGGAVVVLPDGQVVLADFYIDQEMDQPDDRPKEVALNPRILLQANSYSQFIDKQLGFLGTRTGIPGEAIKNLSLRENNFHYFVVKDQKELTSFCAPGIGKNFILSIGVKVETVVCTSGNETFIVEGVFKRLTLHEQTIILIHERLSALRDYHGGRDLKNVGTIASSLSVLLQLVFEQQQNKLRLLTEAELKSVQGFYNSFIHLLTHNRNEDVPKLEYKLHPRGAGILVDGAQVHPGAFVSLDSYLNGKIVVSERAQIKSSSLMGPLEIKEDVIVSQSKISHPANEYSHSVLGIGSQVSNSEIMDSGINLGPYGVIKDSLFDRVEFDSGPKVFFKHVHMKATIFSRIRKRFELDGNQKIVNASITNHTLDHFSPQGFKVIPLVFELENFPTPCHGKEFFDLEPLDFITLKELGCISEPMKKQDAEKLTARLPDAGPFVHVRSQDLLVGRSAWVGHCGNPCYRFMLRSITGKMEYTGQVDPVFWQSDKVYMTLYKGKIYPIGEAIVHDWPSFKYDQIPLNLGKKFDELFEEAIVKAGGAVIRDGYDRYFTLGIEDW